MGLVLPAAPTDREMNWLTRSRVVWARMTTVSEGGNDGRIGVLCSDAGDGGRGEFFA